MYAWTRDGREFHSSPHHQFAVILRYMPDRLHHPGVRTETTV